MRTKNQISLTRKTLYGIMLLGIFLSAFGAGNLPAVHALGIKTNHSKIVFGEFVSKYRCKHFFPNTIGSKSAMENSSAYIRFYRF